MIAVVVALFVILDVALIGYAVMRSDPPSPGATPGPIPTFGSSSTAVTTPDLPIEPTIEPVVVEAQSRHLVVTSASAGWRSTVGTCTGPSAVVESTIDGGATWQQVNPPEVREVLYVSANASLVTILAKTGDACTLEVLKSFTGGQFWGSYPDEVTGYTHFDPANPAAVQTPGGPLSVPCLSVNEAKVRGDATVVACAGELVETSNAGGDWSSVVVPGLLGATGNDAGYTLAVSGAADCAGVSIQTLTAPLGTAAPTAVGCVDPEAAPSQVSIAQTGSDIWLWSGDRVFVSTDNGASWN
ncbi:MAG: hypothetical protein ACOH1U_07930 [Rhodoglobus sp.]